MSREHKATHTEPPWSTGFSNPHLNHTQLVLATATLSAIGSRTKAYNYCAKYLEFAAAAMGSRRHRYQPEEAADDPPDGQQRGPKNGRRLGSYEVGLGFRVSLDRYKWFRTKPLYRFQLVFSFPMFLCCW